ncbi:MAG TPA: hypothetical protein VFK38_05695 [Candidatus Limnocylindrales bacterium]|nr:hypothetical protein [Candidatus Limnocylindrales bacterium]
MRRLALAPLLLALTACSAGSSSSPTPGGAPGASGGGGSGLPQELEAAIVADATRRASVTPDQVAVIESRAVTWSDGSLGCPQPGQIYTQALVEGFQVLVEAGGMRLDYRAGRSGQFKLCEQPAGTPGGGVDDY